MLQKYVTFYDWYKEAVCVCVCVCFEYKYMGII